MLSGCLELKVTVTFKTGSTGTVEIEGVKDHLSDGLDWQGLVFPSSRVEWAAIVAQSPGSSFTSFEAVADDLGTHTKTVLGFSTSRGLESLFVSFKQKLTLLQDAQGKTTLTYAPLVPKLSAAAAETRKLWIDLWGDTQWSLKILPPNNASAAVYAVALRDFASEKAPAEWKLNW
ncbi:MAG: hypothetical protein WCG80_00780 [Spirochaetales bacterium]